MLAFFVRFNFSANKQRLALSTYAMTYYSATVNVFADNRFDVIKLRNKERNVGCYKEPLVSAADFR